jgi:hypothetical protein
MAWLVLRLIQTQTQRQVWQQAFRLALGLWSVWLLVEAA